MKVAVSSDHRGYKAKEQVKGYLAAAGHTVLDFGCDSPASCDYPDTAVAGAESIASGEADRGVFFLRKRYRDVHRREQGCRDSCRTMSR